MRALFALLCLVATASCFTHYAVLKNVYQTQNSPATGVGIALFDLSVNTLSWWVIHNVSADLTAAHIHAPALPGTNANPVITFNNPMSPIVGSMVINTQMATWINTGMAYINIHTTGIPAGAIRGQILTKWQGQVALTGDQERPTPNTSAKKGQALYSYDMMTKMFKYTIIHNVVNVTGAHIHGPADMWSTGPVLWPLVKKSNVRYEGSVMLDDMMAWNFMAGMLYFNIHSQKFPGGEVRANIMPPAMFGAGLTGYQEVPPVDTMMIGLAIGWRVAAMGGDWLRVVAAHHVMNTTNAHVHGPAMVGMTGPPFIFFPNPTSWFVESAMQLDMNSTMWLENHMMYVNIHSTMVPSGEIRGQLWRLE